MKRTACVILLLGTGVTVGSAQSTSSSVSYDLLQAPLGEGGGQVGNGSNITAQVSIGGVFSGEVSAVTAGGVQHKPNYIGQLYDVTGLSLGAVPTTIDEGGSRQLSATATLDDFTLLSVDGDDVQWSVVLGPLTGIDVSGLATADLVYEDTAATVEGMVQGFSGSLELTVLDTDPDNFGGYSGDGIGDDWQVSYFGPPPNADAAPENNPDRDPHDNRFEFLTGYDPTDPGDFFTFALIDLTGAETTLELSKIVPGTRYRIERSLDLEQSDPWTEFTSITTGVEIIDHQFTDPDGSGIRWFYRVGVESE